MASRTAGMIVDSIVKQSCAFDLSSESKEIRETVQVYCRQRPAVDDESDG